MSNGSAFRYALLLGLGSLAATPATDYRISGPYTHDNLSIFLLHGSGGGSGRKYLTLQEAMDQKKVAVYETGNVQELSIENSSSEDVYIQAGDIVKGGQQDRVFPDDFILTSKSGKVPIASFCVERGRWSKRGGEDVHQFAVSSQAVAGKSLKMAVRNQRDQSQVWNEVAKAQQSLALAEEMGMRYDLGMAHLEMGRRLDDREHLSEAETIFAEIGAEYDLERARKHIHLLAERKEI